MQEGFDGEGDLERDEERGAEIEGGGDDGVHDGGGGDSAPVPGKTRRDEGGVVFRGGERGGKGMGERSLAIGIMMGILRRCFRCLRMIAEIHSDTFAAQGSDERFASERSAFSGSLEPFVVCGLCPGGKEHEAETLIRCFPRLSCIRWQCRWESGGNA
jgi:hypothetical protein